MNVYGHSDVEVLILDALKIEFGEIHEAMDEKIVQGKIDASKKLYERGVNDYRVNQSSYNYNILITAMLSLQYWNQKKARFFSISEEF
jgi:hypothetical protein